MKKLLDLVLIAAMVIVPIVGARRSPRWTTALWTSVVVGYSFYILYIGPRLA